MGRNVEQGGLGGVRWDREESGWVGKEGVQGEGWGSSGRAGRDRNGWNEKGRGREGVHRGVRVKGRGEKW